MERWVLFIARERPTSPILACFRVLSRRMFEGFRSQCTTCIDSTQHPHLGLVTTKAHWGRTYPECVELTETQGYLHGQLSASGVPSDRS